MQRYTVCFNWKLLYTFRVVTPPIIRSANNCIYSIWYLSHRYCYLLLSWQSWNWITHHQERKQLYLQHLVFVTSLLLPAAIVEELEPVWVCCGWRRPQIQDAVDTVVCAPDDGWWYHPKHVEQFPDKINSVTLHLVGYKLEYLLRTSIYSAYFHDY